MAKAKVDALVLTEAAGSTPVNLVGLPGEWVPGVPVEVGELARVAGITADELLGLVDELDAPLERIKVNAGDAPVVWPDNHVPVGLADASVAEPDAGDEPDADETAVAEPDPGEGADG